MYSLGKHRKSKHRRLIFWLIVLLFVTILVLGLILFLRPKLAPKTVITKSTPRTSKVTYDTKTKHYEEADFSLDLPVVWQPVPRPPGPYQTFGWQTSVGGSKGQQITIFEDTIPVNFAVNRVLIVEGQTDRLQVDSSTSENCSTFTRGLTPQPGQVGVPAKWQSINFLCDQFNQHRDVIGTSSSDGVNTVLLKNQSTGVIHKFFFTYTNQVFNPDYSAFYATLQSFRMQ